METQEKQRKRNRLLIQWVNLERDYYINKIPSIKNTMDNLSEQIDNLGLGDIYSQNDIQQDFYSGIDTARKELRDAESKENLRKLNDFKKKNGWDKVECYEFPWEEWEF